ncbi:enoyl-hydratase [Stylonychia lemnae]|uniref:Enoyl-hydratase n=1 Tax=Stylonychia lemnae TaxID=5949 RepID=A0A078B6B5_STYLE|nr:enoyl-hydratase [Stylonychia lemnae]|eukprot:CDW89899.1 enoyl-hydratase [Stylonychia lemnae]
MNAMTFEMFVELNQIVNKILDQKEKEVRVIILTHNGKHFTAGLDISSAAIIMKKDDEKTDDVDCARVALGTQKSVRILQESASAAEKARVPVICAMSGFVIGAGIDISSACDIRICSKDAKFTIKEVDIGICADLGTIQRFQKIIGNDSFFRELAYTGRYFDAKEALQQGFVSYVEENQEACFKKAYDLASQIASKSPVAVATIKQNIVYSRDNPVEMGLQHVLLLNMSMLQTKDTQRAVMANFSKSKAEFPKL